MVNDKSINILGNTFNKIQKLIIKHKITIISILILLGSYLLILFSTRNLDTFQDSTTETTTTNADACASLRGDLLVLQEEKQSLKEQISNLENQVTTIEEECDETEANLTSEKEDLMKKLEDANGKYADVNEQYNNLLEEYNVLVNENTTTIDNMEQQITELQKNLKECNLKCSESFQDTQNDVTEAEENLNEDTTDNNQLIALLRLDSDSILRNSRSQQLLNIQTNINLQQDRKLRRLHNILLKT
jgi:chromosome segregation ATPase